MSMHESLAAAALAGVLALSFPLSARGLDITSIRTPRNAIALPSASFALAGSASPESASAQGVSLAKEDDGAIVVRRSDGLQKPGSDTDRSKEATWKGTIKDKDGVSREVEILLRDIDITGLSPQDTALLVQSDDAGSGIQIGFMCKNAPAASARYEVSIRLAGARRDAAAGENLPLALTCPSGGKLMPKAGALAPDTSTPNAPEPALEQALAPLPEKTPATVEVSHAWTDLIWDGYGTARLSATSSAPVAGTGTDGASGTKGTENTDARSETSGSDDQDPGASSGPDTADEAPDTGEGADSAGANEPTSSSTPAIAVEAGSDLAGALGAASDIDAENFTAAVALDSPALLAAAPVTQADTAPTRQYVILTCPKTFEFVLLPSGEVIAPTALTILGGQRAYNDIKNMSLANQNTQATLELYATEADGSLTMEFDGTTYLKGYRRMGVNEDIPYTAKLKGFDYAQEQDLVMAAITEPQRLFTLRVTFIPVIPSS